jgi:lincosamide nucleotidyltransferase A/C/D/E
MEAADVLQVLEHLRLAGIRVYVAGGWGIDALIGEQSRPHADLDLALDTDGENRVLLVLRRNGFQMTTDERPARFVLQDQIGRQIDFHPVVFDAVGNGVQSGGGGFTYRYPSTGFDRGTIGGKEVDCLSAELLVQFHLGYTATEKDIADMELLREKLGVPLPFPYS